MNDLFAGLGNLFNDLFRGGGAAPAPQSQQPDFSTSLFNTRPDLGAKYGGGVTNPPQRTLQNWEQPLDALQAQVTAPFREAQAARTAAPSPRAKSAEGNVVEGVNVYSPDGWVPMSREAPMPQLRLERDRLPSGPDNPVASPMGELPPDPTIPRPEFAAVADRRPRTMDPPMKLGHPAPDARTKPLSLTEEVRLKTGPRLRKYGNTPFSVPEQTTTKDAEIYSGPTYAVADPNETIEVEGLNVRYAAEPGNTYSKTAPRPIQGLIFHHTSGSPSANSHVKHGQTVDKARGGKFGYHFYVDRAGNVIQGAPLSARTNHLKPSHLPQRTGAKHLNNSNSISVSLIGDGRSPTKAQLDSAAKIGRALQDRFQIGTNNIFGHGDVQGGKGGDREAWEGHALAVELRTRK